MSALLLTGCASETYEPVELVEPVGGNDFYRPVERGNVGDITVEFGSKSDKKLAVGSVVYKETPYYFTTRVKVSNINVNVGDTVKAGDVLAYVDTKDINEEIADIRDDIDYENQSYVMNNELYDVEHELTKANRDWSKELDLKDNAKMFGDNLEFMEESHRFDEEMHNLKISQLEKDIQKKAELTNDSRLVAKTDGIVTFVKDLKLSDYVSSEENVVVIADTSEKYIELSNCTIAPADRHYLDAYDQFYTYVNGEKCDIYELPFTPEQISIAANKNQYPCMRFTFADPDKIPAPGANVLIYMSRRAAENVLLVGKDSIMTDEKGQYVYVLKDGKKEVRYITTGSKNDNYYEVVDGLSEGELVYYNTNTFIIGNYEEVDVVKSTYSNNVEASSYKMLNLENVASFSEHEGVVNSINISDGSEVKKGQVVLTIQINEGSADLASVATQAGDAYLSYDANIKELDKQRKDLLDKQDEYLKYSRENKLETKKTEEFTFEDRMNIYDNEIVKIQLKQIDSLKKKALMDCEHQVQVSTKLYNKLNKDNNGKGLISVYASCDGKISNMKVTKGKVIKPGDRLFDVEKSVDEFLTINTNSVMHNNQTVIFTGQTTTNKYKGHIIGGPGLCHNVYISNKKDHMYFTHNTADSNKVQYYVVMDDPEFYKAVEKFDAAYTSYEIENAVIIPLRAMYRETVMNDEYTFVWKIMDGNLVKQYVTPMTDKPLLNDSICIIGGLEPGDKIAIERGY